MLARVRRDLKTLFFFSHFAEHLNNPIVPSLFDRLIVVRAV
ncbi:MAG: hypothetical protein ACTMUP_01420 [cyanobacterium endosymbiont of Rhopalodia musculus]